ncbi:MAG: hypothetical protein V1656_00050 [Candidatus Jorgensenbacteria bacterium]
MKKGSSRKIKIWWKDAVLYSRGTPDKMRLEPTEMETSGVLVKESKEGFFVAGPYTVRSKDGKRVAKEQGANFLFIPHGMVEKVE